MAFKLPNRDEWMTGKLATSPARPPFPSFTEFELRVLDCIASMFGDEEGEFRKQVAASRVTDRINTIVGFYTRVAVDRSACRPLPIQFKGGHFEVDAVEHRVGVVLWEEEGYLETIEGFTYDEDSLRGRELADLKFIALSQPG